MGKYPSKWYIIKTKRTKAGKTVLTKGKFAGWFVPEKGLFRTKKEALKHIG